MNVLLKINNNCFIFCLNDVGKLFYLELLFYLWLWNYLI